LDTAELDHVHAHAHGTGVRWLDIIVGISAVFISVVSLIVSINHGSTMERMVQQNERMVAANTMPFLTFAGNQADPATNARRERLVLSNDGVGPALIDWFQIRYKGVAYGSEGALLRACCAQALSAQDLTNGVYYANVTGTVLPAREATSPIDITPSASSALMDAVDRARSELSVSACYCSVLEECWVTEFSQSRPRRVPDCRVPNQDAMW